MHEIFDAGSETTHDQSVNNGIFNYDWLFIKIL